MSEEPIIARLLAYVPPDRASAVLEDRMLPSEDDGAVLFSDISGFTPLTELVIARYGPRLGGEQFTDRLNAVYDALIRGVERFGGSIVGFAGDAMVVWYSGDDGSTAVTTALHLQRTMEQFASVALPSGETVSLAMKVAVARGRVRRFQVGDPGIQALDAIAGEVMERVAACEGVAARGEIVVDYPTAQSLQDRLAIREWRPLARELGGEAAVITALRDEVAACPAVPPPLPADAIARLRPWLLPEIGRRILSEQDVFLTELRPASALFAHFSGIDFEHDPEAPAKLDSYVRWVQQVVTRLEGILVQLTLGEKGSYFYAAWGAPVAHDNDTTRAFTAALEILRPPAAIAPFITATQIGITQGTMRTGAYGNRHRRTYGVLGDDTNLAARLMAKAAPQEILVSAHAARRQEEFFELQSLPSVKVKGKQEPVPVLRLLSRKRAGTAPRASVGHHALPMVGRDAELRVAEEKLRRARGGRGQVLTISAAAGLGKSRLVAELVHHADELGFTTLAASCPALGRDASYSVWIPIWRTFFQLPPEGAPDSARADVERQVAAAGRGLEDRAPLLGPLLNVAWPDNPLTRTLEPKVRRSSLEGLVVECIRHRARSGPLLFVLEECHWIDEASRNLLAAIVHGVTRIPAGVVLVHRPAGPTEILGANAAGLEYLTRLELTELPTAESRRLVGLKLDDAFGPGHWPAQLADRIAEHAEGNPFFIEEVVNLLQAQGTNLAVAGEQENLELPESLHSLSLSRIDQLTEATQTTLKVASVIGRNFRTNVLFGVHPIEQLRPHIPVQLGEMQAHDIVLPESREAYVFKHILVQEVAYESLPSAFRAGIHEAIGDHLERAAGADPRAWVDLLAFHYGRSQRDDKKRRYFVAAGDSARAAYALQSAIGHYERVLPLLDGGARIDVLAHLGEVLELAGRWDDAFRRYREAREQAEAAGRPGPRAAMSAAIGDLLRKRGEFPAAEPWIDGARQEYAELGDQTGVALTLHLAGTLNAQTGNFARATELFQQALRLREELGAEGDAAKTLNNLGIVARSQGDIPTALAYYERSLAIRRRINDRREIANSLNNLGFVHRFRKDFNRARQLLEESVQLNRTVGDRWSTANALTSLAELALDTGDADLAQRCLQESIGINRELGDRRALAFLLEGFGQLGRLRNEGATALLFLAAARALRTAIGAPLEPADATRIAVVLEQLRAQVPAPARERVESEGESLPLGDVLDRTLTAFP